MVERKIFNGVLNKDDSEDKVLPLQHIDCVNGRFVAGQFQNIKGNYLISNASLPGTGTNKPNGAFYDPKRKRLYWFNRNSGGLDGLYYLNMNTLTVSKVFLCGTDSATNIFNLSLDYPILSMAVVYRTPSDGDLLYWTDNYNRPRYLNVDTVATLTPFTEDMINAGKNAPPRRPSVSYANDSNVNVNNLRKQLFRFCYRWKYANLDFSTWSDPSIVPLPVDGFTPDTQNSSTLNNNISVIMFAGGEDTIALELAVQVSLGAGWSDFLSVDTFNMSEYSISPGGSYTYKFFNDGAYSIVSGLYINETPKDGELYYSYLPDKANALEALNGNVIIYGCLTDGYPAMQRSDVDVNITTGSTNPNIPSISFQYTDGSAGVFFIGPVITTGAIYHIQFSYVSGGVPGSSSVNYATPIGATSDSIAIALAALLNAGFVQAVASSDTIRLTITGVAPSLTNVQQTVSVTGSESAGAAWPWSCNEQLALIYFDDRMKPVAVVSFTTAAVDTTDFTVTTQNFSTNGNIPQVPFLSATINHVPPIGATTYQWLRADKKPKFLQWITNDYQTDANYLYLCIQNLNYTQDKLDGYIPSYEFVKGDRIRVMAKYDSVSTVLTPFNAQLDMEILGEEERLMNSPAVAGRFIKVAKPATFPTIPYGVNMFIQLYTPQFNLDITKQFYFAWGQEYSIYSITQRQLTYTALLGTLQVGDTITQATTGATGLIVAVNSTTIYVTNTTGTFLPGFTFIGVPSGATGTITVVGSQTTNRYHEGQIQNQTATQPATFQWFDGDVYYKNRTFYLNVNDALPVVEFMMDANYSDYFSSAVNSNARAWKLDPDAAAITRQTQSRWGQSYIQDTNINKLNIFYPNDFDTYDLAGGQIQRFKARERIMRVFQEHNVGEVGVYSRFIKDSGETTILETSDTIITTNNIQYYKGECGLGSQPSALISARDVDYFTYPVTGNQFRLSGDGMTNISELYKGQYYFKNILVEYNKPYTLTDGSLSKIMGAYDYFDEQAIWIPQGGTYNGATILPYGFSFNEPRNGYCASEYSFKGAQWIAAAEDKIVTWSNGQIYLHDSSTYCNFFGTQYDASITIVINGNLNEKKTWESIIEIASTIFRCPVIYSNVMSYGTQRQETSLITEDFTIFEGNPSASILRDSNSIGGILNGDTMKGNWLAIKFIKSSASELVYLTEVSVLTRDSPLTSR